MKTRLAKSTEEETMLDLKSVILMLLPTAWGVTTVFLVGALIYRGILSLKEDDQIFIDDAEQRYTENSSQSLSV